MGGVSIVGAFSSGGGAPYVVSRLRPSRSEPLSDRGAIARLRTPLAASPQDGTSWSLPAKGCDGSEIENALVERERFADAALVAGQSRVQHRQPGAAQPIAGRRPRPPPTPELTETGA